MSPAMPHSDPSSTQRAKKRRIKASKTSIFALVSLICCWLLLPSPLMWEKEETNTVEKKQAVTDSGQHLFGFFLNEYKQPKASYEAIKSIAAFMPGSPIYLLASGGYHYDPLAKRFAHQPLIYVYEEENVDLKTGNNALAGLQLYLRRVRDAAIKCNCSYLVLMEPDVILRAPIRDAPEHDAGGLNDKWNQWDPKFKEEFHVSKWSHEQWGMAGGSYVKVSSYLDAYATLDYDRIQRMQIGHNDVLLAVMFMDQGYMLRPWKDVSELDMDDINVAGPTPVLHKVKRFYNEPLTREDGPVIRNDEAESNGWPVYE